MNSPLERHEVRLRGLPQRASPKCTGRGIAGANAASVHNDGARQELSAQADIALS